MATDTWLDGTDNWDTPSDWSDGLPTASSDVVIDQGDPQVTASFGTVNSIALGTSPGAGQLTFIDAGASSVAGNVTLGNTNARRGQTGYLWLDHFTGHGGSSLKIGGTLDISDGLVAIGNGNTLSAASTVTAARVRGSGSGAIFLSGSSTAEATLDIGSRAGFDTAGVFTGSAELSGDALLEFARGQITTLAADSDLTLNGSHAFVADASNIGSNSALRGLTSITGPGGLELANGASVTTSSDLTNNGAILLDYVSGDGGGSILHVKGTLTNSGDIEIGNLSLSATTTLAAGSVVNDSTIDLSGNEQAGVYAALRASGVFTNDGTVKLTNDILSNNDNLGPVSGTGDFYLSKHSTLNFGSSVSSGETVTFHNVDKLILGQPTSFDGTIDDFFAAGDTVVVKGFAEATTLLAYTQTGVDSCSLTLTDGANKAVLNFAGEPYTQGDFSLVPWNGGAGSAIKFV
jgi:hypothetical protein